MDKRLRERMDKDIAEFERKYPGRIYSPKLEKELMETKKRWIKATR